MNNPRQEERGRATLTEYERKAILSGLRLTPSERLSGQAPVSIPSPRMIEDAMGDLWTTKLYTSKDVQSILVQLVSEGLSVPQALARLADVDGLPVPTHYRVGKWIKEVPEFSQAMEVAKALRGEIMVEEALNLALTVNPDTAQAYRTAIAHLQWHGAKLAPEQYTERKTVEVKNPVNTMSEEDLNRRIADLLAKKQIRDHIPVLASSNPAIQEVLAQTAETTQQDIQDAEVVEESTDPSGSPEQESQGEQTAQDPGITHEGMVPASE